MKFIHLSDLHVGKRVNEYSMLEDQRHIFGQILDIVREENPDAVIIAGDVYDKSIPPLEAVTLLDDFLFELSESVKNVFVISGNHDSPERLSFASRLLEGSGVYISPVYHGEVQPILLNDEYGEIGIYLLPFIKPQTVARYHDAEPKDYNDAMRIVIDNMKINSERRNLLVTHQFVTGSSRTESEEISVGGSDNVDATVFEPFDYTALGHIHRAQSFLGGRVRYSGTPLKYSFSEISDRKTVTVVTLSQKGSVEVAERELVPLHGMSEIRGCYLDLMKKSFYDGKSYRDDYLHVILTDEDDIPDAVSKLRTVYKNLMKLDYDNTRTHSAGVSLTALPERRKSPLEYFADFFEEQNGKPLTEEQQKTVKEMIEQICSDDLKGGVR